MLVLVDNLEQKLKDLIQKEEKRLNVSVIGVEKGKNNNAYILARKKSNGEYCVWTSFYTGEIETSYEGFYSGEYTFELMEAIKEFTNRVTEKRQQEIVSIVDSNNYFPQRYYYDVTNMEGKIKDFHSQDDDGNNLFDSYDDYEEDLINRGAIPIQITEYEI